MTRKSDPNARYNISIHKTNGFSYASTQVPFINEKTGKRAYKRVHWGTVTEDRKFIPGSTYLLAALEERSKLRFPDDWDLSEAKKLSGSRTKGRPSIEGQDENRLYGDIWLLEQIAEETGLRSDLMSVFSGNQETVDALLTLAMFFLAGNGTYNHVKGWQKIVKTPSSTELSASYITSLLQSITDQNRMDLFRMRAKRVEKNEFCAVDSTSRSAYGDSLCDIQYGKNKDHLPLPQTLEVVVYTLEGHMPIYYRSFPGNIPDSRSLQTILNDLDNAGMSNIVLITDRGYDTIKNLETYIVKDQPMIMAAKVGQEEIRKRVDQFQTCDHHPEEMELDVEEGLYVKQFELEYQIENQQKNVKRAKNLKLNLYFNPIRRCLELSYMNSEIIIQERRLKEILENQETLDDEKSMKKNFSWFSLKTDEAGRTLVSYTRNEKKINRHKRDAGFFANFTQGLDLSPIEAHRHYKLRDEQEKYFSMMKGTCRSDRQRNWSESAKEGSRFVLFLAQVMGGYLSHARKTVLNSQFSSMSEVLDTMRPIRYIEHPHKQPFITPFVGKQVTICEAMKLEIPKGCSPEYILKKDE